MAGKSIAEKTAILLLLLVFSIPVVAAKTYGLVFDANGNIVGDGRFAYEYNDFNQLSRVNDSNGVIAEFFYDHEGNRVKKVSDTGVTLYSGSDFVRVINGSGMSDTLFVYADGVLLAQKENGEIMYYHPDHLGGTSVVTDKNGAVVEETSYYPFGMVSEGGDSRFLFTGQEKDKETGLMYYGARYYDPSLMRFVQPDVVLQNLYDPQALNRFAYARNNPVKNVDPSGNAFGVDDALLILIAVGVIKVVSFLIDYGIDAYDAYQAVKILSDPEANEKDKEVAAEMILLIAVTEGLEPDEASPINTPADDVARSGKRAQLRTVNNNRKSTTSAPSNKNSASPGKESSRNYRDSPDNLKRTERKRSVPRSESPVWADLSKKGKWDKEHKAYKYNNKYYTWDNLHNEIEVFDSKGRHLGVIDPTTGDPIKSAKPGRRI